METILSLTLGTLVGALVATMYPAFNQTLIT